MGCDICHIELAAHFSMSPASNKLHSYSEFKCNQHSLLPLCGQTTKVFLWILFEIVSDFWRCQIRKESCSSDLPLVVIRNHSTWTQTNTLVAMKAKEKTKLLSKKGKVLCDTIEMQELMNYKRCNRSLGVCCPICIGVWLVNCRC